MKNTTLLLIILLGIHTLTHGQISGESRKFQLSENLSIEMIWIAPGEFMMGSPASEPERYATREIQHKVKLTRGFWIAKTETTQKVWESIMGANPSKIKQAQHPVEQVSWNDAQRFIKKLNSEGAKFRLPYEAEWEYACRAGSQTPYAGDREKMTWHSGNSYGTTHRVASKEPNTWGLYDMHGNVSEMCLDWYTDDISQLTVDPMGPKTGTKRVERGGQYTGRIRHTRAADRSAGEPNKSAFFVGFRLVHD